MSDKRDAAEQAYINGSRMANLLMLQECRRKLGYDYEGATRDRWIIEHEQAVQALKILCDELGLVVEWDEKLHLADLIEKRIGRPLKQAFEANIDKKIDALCPHVWDPVYDRQCVFCGATKP